MTYRHLIFLFVDPLGLEPRITEPKSAVLPITPWVNVQKRRKDTYEFRYINYFYHRNF